MWNYVSIVKTQEGLTRAKDEITKMLKEKNGRLLTLRLLTALQIVDAALNRQDSVGVHYIKS